VRIRNLHKKMKEDGFTLIELMIVICIIACIIACSMGFYYWQLQRAKNIEAESNLLGVRNGCEACWYMSDKYDECAMTTDMITNKTKVTCLDNSSMEEQTSYVLTSNDVQVDLNPVPLMNGDVYSIRAYHNQGSVTYCYSNAEGVGVVTEVEGKDAICP